MYNLLVLGDLEDEIKEAIQRGAISLNHAVELAWVEAEVMVLAEGYDEPLPHFQTFGKLGTNPPSSRFPPGQPRPLR